MLLLVENIVLGLLQLRSTHGIDLVAFLPVQFMYVVFILLVKPVGAAALDRLHGLGQGNVSRQKCQDVHMVPDAVDQHRHATGFFDDAAHIGKQGRSFRRMQGPGPVLGGKDEMIEQEAAG